VDYKFLSRNSLNWSSRKLASPTSISSSNCAVVNWLRHRSAYGWNSTQPVPWRRSRRYTDCLWDSL